MVTIREITGIPCAFANGAPFVQPVAAGTLECVAETDADGRAIFYAYPQPDSSFRLSWSLFATNHASAREALTHAVTDALEARNCCVSSIR